MALPAGSAGQRLVFLASVIVARELVVGEPVPVRLGVQQSTAGSGTYRIVVRRGDDVVSTVGPISVNRGETWEQSVDLVSDAVGADQIPGRRTRTSLRRR